MVLKVFLVITIYSSHLLYSMGGFAVVLHLRGAELRAWVGFQLSFTATNYSIWSFMGLEFQANEFYYLLV